MFLTDQLNLTLMIVHAHPDDEVIGSGGTFLHYANEGITTVLVCCTSGEEGEIVDPAFDQEEAKPRLGEIRQGELRSATEVLKISSLEFLGYRDSGMAGTPANENPECFHQANVVEATTRLVRLIRQYRPHVLASYNDFGTYGHPDHIKAYVITHEAFDRAADPSFDPSAELAPWQPLKLYDMAMIREQVDIWARNRREEVERTENGETAGDPDAKARADADKQDELERGVAFFETIRDHSMPLAEVTTKIAIGAYWDLKRTALRFHRTQIPADSFFFKPNPDIPTELRDFEHFNLVRSLVAVPPRETDLFAGLR